MKHLWPMALLLLALGLSACGGGGGSPSTSAGTACVWGSTNWDGCNWQ